MLQPEFELLFFSTVYKSSYLYTYSKMTGPISRIRKQWVISLSGLVLSLSGITTYVYSQAARSKFILIIVGIYMSSSIYYYYGVY